MKKLQLLLATLVCSLVFASAASAAPATYPMNFWAVDMNGDNSVTLDILNFDFLGGVLTLQYAVNNTTSWNNAGEQITLKGDLNQIFFQLIAGPDTLTNGKLSFKGQLDTTQLYNSATIAWMGYPDISIATPGGTDKVSPVPVPPAAYLLASGVIGIITMRRKKAADQA